jgi:Uma2 family endonuclease
MVALAKIPVRMSVEEFVNWNPGDGRHWQLVDGEPRTMAPSTRTHGTIQSRIAYLLTGHFERHRSPCVVVTEPGIVPRALSEHNMRVPDLAVTCSAYDAEESALSDPVLIIEILSPSNQAETWANVWAYTSIPSVREILVLRTDRVGADLLLRQGDGTWPERPAPITDGELVLASIGFQAPLSEVYARTRLARR